MGQYFGVRRELRQVCVMSTCLFNVFFDRVVRRVDKRAELREGKLRDGREREWEMKQLLYVDDIVFMAESIENIQKIVNEFEKVCNRMELKVSFD